MNSYNTDIFFSNYYNLQSVHFEMYVSFEDFSCNCKRKLSKMYIFPSFQREVCRIKLLGK